MLLRTLARCRPLVRPPYVRYLNTVGEGTSDKLPSLPPIGLPSMLDPAPPKRGRGRPRKSSVVFVETSSLQDNAPKPAEPKTRVRRKSAVEGRSKTAGTASRRKKSDVVWLDVDIPPYEFEPSEAVAVPALRTKYRPLQSLDSDGVPSSPSESDEAPFSGFSSPLPSHFKDAVGMEGQSMLDKYRGGWKLSVSDLVSPMYCELQNFYKLYTDTKRTTAAMKRGTEIHSEREKAEYEELEVDTEGMTREEIKAAELIDTLLRLLSLCRLASEGREDAVVREVRAPGFIDGVYVSGIIDEVQFVSDDYHPPGVEYIGIGPNPERPRKAHRRFQSSSVDSKQSGTIFSDSTEAQSPSDSQQSTTPQSQAAGEVLSPNRKQSSITQFITTSTPQEATLNPSNDDSSKPRRIRLGDDKTRQSDTFPEKSQRDSAYYQVLIYKRLFEDLTEGKFDYAAVAQYLNLDLNTKLSEKFHSQITENEFVVDLIWHEIVGPRSPSLTDLSEDEREQYVILLLNYETLGEVWKMLCLKFKEFRGKVSDQLSVTYIGQQEGTILGGFDYTYKEEDFEAYIKDMLSYWRAERDPKGVEVEEAHKCRYCDFNNRCDWRLTKIRESAVRNRQAFLEKYGKEAGVLEVSKEE
ncbi:exonuclease V [Myxozyma melibiosi]|uniref:Exonuclease V, mitochondrial n=1 Tax=Myxozyma melibiosi TaxID=54550 RepID=A0ABR1F9T5_9ASCO